MKKGLLLVMALLICAASYAYDIAVENEDGVTFYYNYINDGKELAVTGVKECPEELVIPSKVTFMHRERSVTQVSDEAFSNKTMKKVVIPNTITYIGEEAFYECKKLENLYISDGKTELKIMAPIKDDQFVYGGSFTFCSNLKRIYWGRDVRVCWVKHTYGSEKGLLYEYLQRTDDKPLEIESFTIGPYVTMLDNIWENATLKNLYITNLSNYCQAGRRSGSVPKGGVTNLYINGVKISDIVVPDGVDSISSYSFYKIPIYSIKIPSSIKSIGNYAFYSAPLTSVTLSYGIKTIGANAFCGCSALESINLPNSITGLGNSAFSSCKKLKSVNIPNQLKTIENRTFYDCSALKKIDIPNSVHFVGSEAFSGCNNMEELVLGKGVLEIDGAAFSCSQLSIVKAQMQYSPSSFSKGFSNNTLYNGTLYIPRGCSDNYKYSGFTYVEEDSNISTKTYKIHFHAGFNARMSIENCRAYVAWGRDTTLYIYEGNSILLKTKNNAARPDCDYDYLLIDGVTKYELNDANYILDNINSDMDIEIVYRPTYVKKSDYKTYPYTWTFEGEHPTSGLGIHTDYSNYDEMHRYFNEFGDGYIQFNTYSSDNYIYIPNLLKGQTVKVKCWGNGIEFYNLQLENEASNEHTFKVEANGFAKINFRNRSTLYEISVGEYPFDTKTADIQNEQLNDRKFVLGYYSLDGKRLAKPQRGLNIIRMSDGTTKKVIINR